MKIAIFPSVVCVQVNDCVRVFGRQRVSGMKREMNELRKRTTELQAERDALQVELNELRRKMSLDSRA